MIEKKPVIGFMLGDPTGIGPELVAKVLADPEAWRGTVPLVIGDRRVFEEGVRTARVRIPDVRTLTDPTSLEGESPALIDLPGPDLKTIPQGKMSVEAGRATLEALRYGIDLARRRLIDGFVFAPLNKEALMRGGMRQHSELELFKDEFSGNEALEEINILDAMWALRVTSHIPLSAVAGSITMEKVLVSIRFLDAAMRAHGEASPRIAVAALNPHGGENGLCGTEELEIIGPAVESARAEGIAVEGPFPADTVFLKVQAGEFNGLLNMYHDQGQIATKLLGFSRGVTYHAGFIVPITTPAHGTAFDIVGKGIAEPAPTVNAYRIASRIARNPAATVRTE